MRDRASGSWLVTSPRCIALLHMQAEHCRLVHLAVDNGGEEAKEEKEEDREGEERRK